MFHRSVLENYDCILYFHFSYNAIKMNILFRCYSKYQFLRSNFNSTSLVRRQSATFIIFFNYETAYVEGTYEGQGSSDSFLRGQLYFGPLATLFAYQDVFVERFFFLLLFNASYARIWRWRRRWRTREMKFRQLIEFKHASAFPDSGTGVFVG